MDDKKTTLLWIPHKSTRHNYCTNSKLAALVLAKHGDTYFRIYDAMLSLSIDNKGVLEIKPGIPYPPHLLARMIWTTVDVLNDAVKELERLDFIEFDDKNRIVFPEVREHLELLAKLEKKKQEEAAITPQAGRKAASNNGTFKKYENLD